jgi:hypothetical protein
VREDAGHFFYYVAKCTDRSYVGRDSSASLRLLQDLSLHIPLQILIKILIQSIIELMAYLLGPS